MNIILSIEKFLDWFNKNLSRIKTIGLLLLFVLFIISFVSNGCNREQANKLFKQVTGLDLQNDILSLRNRALTDSLNKEKILRLQLEHSRALLLTEKETLAKDNERLKKQLAGIPAWLLNMPADSSYKFLNEIAYPFPGERKYPFNEPQIKNIHADYLENITLTGLVTKLEDQLINCERLGDNIDSTRISYMKSYRMAEEKSSSMEQKAANLDQKATLYEDAYNKSEKRKKFWKATTGITTVVAIVLAILL